MPTKARRERELKHANERAKQEELLENMPDYIRQRIASGRKSTIPLCDDIPKYLNLRGGLLIWDNEGNPGLSPNIGTGANEERKEARIEIVLKLKNKYSGIWGKRGPAKVISIDNKIIISSIA